MPREIGLAERRILGKISPLKLHGSAWFAPKPFQFKFLPMSTETLVPAVETAGALSPSEVSVEPLQREVPSGENIAEAVRNAIKVLGVTAAIIVIPGAIPVAAVTGAAWLVNRMRTQGK